jgi:ArsR family transcriptional regulator
VYLYQTKIYEKTYIWVNIYEIESAQLLKYSQMNPLTLFKCLSDDTRLRCMLLVQDQGELCVCELMQALDQIQPKVSRNLAQLRNCSLLTASKQGQWVYYRLSDELPQWVIDLLAATLKGSPNFLIENIANLKQMGDRPERASMCC